MAELPYALHLAGAGTAPGASARHAFNGAPVPNQAAPSWPLSPSAQQSLDHAGLPSIRVEAAPGAAGFGADSANTSPMLESRSVSPGLRRRHAVFLAQSLFAMISHEPEAAILLSQLPARFKRCTGQSADVRMLGYRKLSDLLLEFPELFRIVGDPKGGHQMVFAASTTHAARAIPGAQHVFR